MLFLRFLGGKALALLSAYGLYVLIAGGALGFIAYQRSDAARDERARIEIAHAKLRAKEVARQQAITRDVRERAERREAKDSAEIAALRAQLRKERDDDEILDHTPKGQDAIPTPRDRPDPGFDRTRVLRLPGY